MKYMEIIDSILDEMQKEYTSAHEATTKAFNFEYTEGKLFGLYDLAKLELSPEDFADLYDYRRADRDDLSAKFNQEYINPVYAAMRKAS